jgi:hypothetical protein
MATDDTSRPPTSDTRGRGEVARAASPPRARFQGGESLLQRTLLFPSRGDVSDDGRRTEQCTVRVVEQRDGELDGDRRPILPHGRHREHPASIPSRSCRHRFSVATPVPLPETLRDDQIQRATERFVGAIARYGGAGW